MPPVHPYRVHYAPYGENAACKSTDRNPSTAVPRKVTCERCMDTSTWQEMMRP